MWNNVFISLNISINFVLFIWVIRKFSSLIRIIRIFINICSSFYGFGKYLQQYKLPFLSFFMHGAFGYNKPHGPCSMSLTRSYNTGSTVLSGISALMHESISCGDFKADSFANVMQIQ